MTHPPTIQKLTHSLTTSLLLLLLACAGAAPAAAASRISQFGITWTFDREYPSGQFANGDYWVVGPVTIVSITPRSTASGGTTKHGSMVNPAPNTAQGYDSRLKANTYSASKNVGLKLPLTLAPGSSLLSAESYEPHATKDNPQLKTIAVLTVLDAPAPPGSFRPPYVGKDKTLRWNKSQLRYDRLQSLRRVSHAPSPSRVAQAFERPWIEQKTNWGGRYLHPAENQPGYGREIAHQLAEALLTLQLDYSKAEKEQLLVRLVQYGIDVYGAARAGASWNHDGGHNHGRKMPLLLAGAVLDDPAILKYGDARQHFIFQEDQQTWYVTPADVGRALFSADRRTRLPYIAADIGIAEWGEKHMGDPSRDGRNWNVHYRAVAGSSTIGHVLTARLMGLQDQWNWPAIFDYYDRYWKIEGSKAGAGANSIQHFVAEMWSRYRSATAAPLSDRNVATDIWENTAVAPQNGVFTATFELLPSSDRVNSVTGFSNGAADAYSDLATSVRLAPSGRIDALDGGSFRAVKAFAYRGGVKYRVTMTVDVAAKRYSVTVAEPGGKPVVIADRWQFRNGHTNTRVLDHLGYRSASGYHAVLGLELRPAGSLLNLLPLATTAVSVAP